MKYKNLTKIILAVLCALFIGVGSGLMFAHANTANGSSYELFEQQSGVALTYNQTAEGTDFADESGLKITSSINGVQIPFKNIYKGCFEVLFYPVSSSTSSFTQTSFTFEDTNGAGREIQVICERDNTIKNGNDTSVSVYWGPTHISKSVSFKAKDGPVLIGFNSIDMQVYAKGGAMESAVVLADLLTSSGLAEAFGTCNSIEPVDEYTVTASLSLIEKGKQAEVILYSVNNQTLSGEELTNSAGAEVYAATLYSGAVNKQYVIDTSSVVVCDVLDGIIPFEGIISVYDPSGTAVDVSNGRFTPESAGTYRIAFVAKDKDGVSGAEKSFYVDVISKHKKAEISLALSMKDITVGNGSTVAVYPATAQSNYFGGVLPVKVTVNGPDGEVAVYNNPSSTNLIKLSKNGQYTVCYSAEDSLGERSELTYTITVDDSLPISIEELNATYPMGEYFIVPTATSANGATVSSYVNFPSGEVVTSRRVKLDKSGVYRIDYKVTNGGAVKEYSYYFEVKVGADTLFEVSKDMKILTNQQAPDYMDVAFKGITFEAGLVNATATYKNIINLNDNTKSDLLAELYLTPLVEMDEEIRSFNIKLTDVNDSNNYVTISVDRNPWGYNNHMDVSAYAYGITNGKSVMVECSRFGKYPAFSDGVYNYTSSFSSSIRLYWDNEEKAVYVDSHKGARTLIADLDNPDYVGVNIFKGFETGEVIFSICFVDPVSTAHVMMSSLDGQSFVGEYVEAKSGPEIFVRWSDENYPNAKVGGRYPAFDAYASDMIDGTVIVERTVYYCSPDGVKQRIPMINGYFKPEYAGEYEIEFKARNSAGLETKKSVFITAKDSSEFEQINIEVSGYPESVYQGETLALLPVTVTGGAGYAKTSLVVYLDDEEYLKISDFTSGSLELADRGTYKLKYVVQDEFIGTSAEKIITLVVSSPSAPVFESLNMPKGMLVGCQYTLPMACANDYSDGTRQNATITTKVNGVPLSDENKREVSFDTAGIVEVVYVAKGQNGATTELKYSIEVVDTSSKDKSIYLSRYFLYGNEVTVSATNSTLDFTSSAKQTVSFINSIPVSIFSVKFSVPSQYANAESVNVILTDTLNPEEKIVLTIKKKVGSADSSLLWINGVEQNACAGAIGGSGNLGMFSFSIDGNNLIDYNGNTFKLVKEDGSEFSGFTSGRVYLDFEIGNGASGTAGLCLTSIVNQMFSSVSTDRIKPIVFIKEEINLYGEKGKSYKLPSAEAYDVLDPNAKLYVYVTKGNQTIIKQTEYREGLEVALDEYGKYNLVFAAVDANHRESESPYLIKVYDRTPPELTIGDYQSKASIGKAVTLATPVSSGTVYVIVISPDGDMQIMDGLTFTPTKTGLHRIVYYAVNEYNVSTIVSYDLIVS